MNLSVITPRVIKLAIAAALLGLTAFCYLHRPGDVQAQHPLVVSVSDRYWYGYVVTLKEKTEPRDVLKVDLFDGFVLFDPRFESKELIGRFNKVDEHHHYVEYLIRTGRLQAHSAFEEGNISHWFELYPKPLAIDELVAPGLAIAFDPARRDYRVDIASESGLSVLVITVQGGFVTRLTWLWPDIHQE